MPYIKPIVYVPTTPWDIIPAEAVTEAPAISAPPAPTEKAWYETWLPGLTKSLSEIAVAGGDIYKNIAQADILGEKMKIQSALEMKQLELAGQKKMFELQTQKKLLEQQGQLAKAKTALAALQTPPPQKTTLSPIWFAVIGIGVLGLILVTRK
jgi:hypothetical protein